jgi:hypothetical protein
MTASKNGRGSRVPEVAFKKHFDLGAEEPLPHGGATDIFGRVIWALTAEEEAEMVKRIQSAFGG